MTGPAATRLEDRPEVLEVVFEQQRRAALAQPLPDCAERSNRLQALKRPLCRYQHRLVDAIDADCGGRTPAESRLIDVMGPVLQINHALRHLRRRMAPSRRRPELLFASTSLKVNYPPKGIVGISVPWNFPVYLAPGPLVAALAAGNRAVLKLSPNSLATAAALYLLGHDRTERERILSATHSGGVTLNDWGWHAFNRNAPFGGIGNSGMGSHHGVEGFRELSRAGTVFRRHRLFPIGLFYPPCGSWVQRLSLWLFIGSEDPELTADRGSDQPIPEA